MNQLVECVRTNRNSRMLILEQVTSARAIAKFSSQYVMRSFIAVPHRRLRARKYSKTWHTAFTNAPLTLCRDLTNTNDIGHIWI